MEIYNNKNSFKILIKEIFKLPVWIKQIIYMELKEQFETAKFKNYISLIKKPDCLQLFIPQLTYTGKKELETKSKNCCENMYKFLESSFQGLNITEIATINRFNFCECSALLVEAINQSFVSPPESNIVKGTALYMAGKIRLGEYFVKIGRISIEQLDDALKSQKQIEEALGDRPGLAEIMINSGVLTKDDTEGILILKEDCKKYYESNLVFKE